LHRCPTILGLLVGGPELAIAVIVVYCVLKLHHPVGCNPSSSASRSG